jgi:hypothetical protein
LSIPVRLVLASMLMLFLELSLIRWSGAQVVQLSYFSNFILLGSFLGIGLGFLRANRSKRRQPFYSMVALLAFVGFTHQPGGAAHVPSRDHLCPAVVTGHADSRLRQAASRQRDGKPPLIADSKETWVCSYLSLTLLLGVGAYAVLSWWWADPISALARLPIISGKDARHSLKRASQQTTKTDAQTDEGHK